MIILIQSSFCILTLHLLARDNLARQLHPLLGLNTNLAVTQDFVDLPESSTHDPFQDLIGGL